MKRFRDSGNSDPDTHPLPPQKKKFGKQNDRKPKKFINHTDLRSIWLNITKPLLKTDNHNTLLHFSDTRDYDYDSKIFKLLCDKC